MLDPRFLFPFVHQIVVATYIGGVAGALTTTSFETPLPTGVNDVISGQLSAARIGVAPGSANSAWWVAHVSKLYTLIPSTLVGLQAVADGKIDGVFAGGALETYSINQGLCSLVVTVGQVSIPLNRVAPVTCHRSLPNAARRLSQTTMDLCSHLALATC